MQARRLERLLMKMYQASDFQLSVRACQIEGSFVKLGFHAPAVVGHLSGPAAFLRCWFPHPEQDCLSQRAYTPVNIDAQAGTFDMYFFVHQPAGPACRWAQQAQVGDTLTASIISADTKAYANLEDEPHWLLVGDPASQPAMINLVEAAPPGTQLSIVMEESSKPEDLLDFPSRANCQIEIHWVGSSGGEETVQAVDMVLGGTQPVGAVFMALERQRLKELRPLVKKLQLPKQQVSLTAYWVKGRQMGKDAV